MFASTCQMWRRNDRAGSLSLRAARLESNIDFISVLIVPLPSLLKQSRQTKAAEQISKRRYKICKRSEQKIFWTVVRRIGKSFSLKLNDRKSPEILAPRGSGPKASALPASWSSMIRPLKTTCSCHVYAARTSSCPMAESNKTTKPCGNAIK